MHSCRASGGSSKKQGCHIRFTYILIASVVLFQVETLHQRSTTLCLCGQQPLLTSTRLAMHSMVSCGVDYTKTTHLGLYSWLLEIIDATCCRSHSMNSSTCSICKYTRGVLCRVLLIMTLIGCELHLHTNLVLMLHLIAHQGLRARESTCTRSCPNWSSCMIPNTSRCETGSRYQDQSND